jgi:hypothetical protein
MHHYVLNPSTEISSCDLLDYRKSYFRPMDKMRQLVRILLALIPSSKSVEPETDNNLWTDDDIRTFLNVMLGDAPHPIWGLPSGYSSFLSGALIFYLIIFYHTDLLICRLVDVGPWFVCEP